jgi:hypothetical protein
VLISNPDNPKKVACSWAPYERMNSGATISSCFIGIRIQEVMSADMIRGERCSSSRRKSSASNLRGGTAHANLLEVFCGRILPRASLHKWGGLGRPWVSLGKRCCGTAATLGRRPAGQQRGCKDQPVRIACWGRPSTTQQARGMFMRPVDAHGQKPLPGYGRGLLAASRSRPPMEGGGGHEPQANNGRRPSDLTRAPSDSARR